MNEVLIAGRPVSQASCLVVAEVAQGHDGSLGMAHAWIDAVANAGADAIKFQTHIADAESTPDEPWRVKFSRQDASRYDYWRRMEFAEDQWHGLKEHADERGLIFLSSPFSVEAVELLERVGVGAWKIPSGEVTNVPMFERMAQTGLPILLSTGMSPLDEIDQNVEWFRSKGLQVVVLQCTSMYPAPPEKLGINVLPLFQGRYDCPVGLSDHSGTIFPALAAVTLGASMVEIHVTFDREMFGPDVPSSITTKDLKVLVEGIRYTEKMVANPVDKDAIAEELAGMRQLFTKSVVARADLAAGTVLLREHLRVKKPGTGIPANKLDDLIGKRLRQAAIKDTILQHEDIE